MTAPRAQLNDDELQLQQALRGLLDRHCPPSAMLAQARDGGVDPALWKALASDADLTGLVVDPRFGGSGADLTVAGAALMEMGRVLYNGPYLTSAVLAPTLLDALGDDEVSADLQPRIAAGDISVAVAGWQDAGRRELPAVAGIGARAARSGWQLDGKAHDVRDAVNAGRLLVLAQAGDGIACFSVDPADPGVRAARTASMDLRRQSADLTFTAAPARLVGHPHGQAGQAVRWLAAVACVALAAEQIGGAERALEIAVEHAKTRRQFGLPIGSFQAVRHNLAQAYVDVAAARAATVYALSAVSSGSPDAELMSHVAKASASDAFCRAARTLVQTLGGIGYTWEHTAHLYLRRAVASRIEHGSPAAHRRALVAHARAPYPNSVLRPPAAHNDKRGLPL
jgi:alkylation response protein AidB-like acyl-CoA dehydrogenase